MNSTDILPNSLYDTIASEGFSAHTLQLIDNYTNDILNGRTNLTRFNQQEHAGSAVRVRCSLGRTPSRVTREQALRQVAMLQHAKEAAQMV